jgi:thiopeptide-type bacteriocin biosynthesis protein
MPADHLTRTVPLTDAIMLVLGGTALHEAAAAAGVTAVDLRDAVDTYHTAGLAALHQQQHDRWYQVRVEFPDWDTAETTAAHQLGPGLDQLREAGAVEHWWFLRKHPCWRLRIRTTDHAVVTDLLDDLTTRGAITCWRPGRYEAETIAFGGPAGMHITHQLFCADSCGVLTYLRHPQPGIGRRELSLLLLAGLLHSAGVDWFERGDVFANVARHRPIDTDDRARIGALVDAVRGLLAVPPDPDSTLFRAEGVAGYATPWLTAHLTAGAKLAQAARANTLDRGLRAIISHLVIFHWNRLGLTARTQGILARAAVEAFLPQD